MRPFKPRLRVIEVGGKGKGVGKRCTTRTQRIPINISTQEDVGHRNSYVEQQQSSPVFSESETMKEQNITDLAPDKGTYKVRKEKAQQRWANVRDAFFNVACSLEVPFSNICSVCSAVVDEVIRCPDCGAFITYCRACERNVHSNLLHKPQIWNVSCNCATTVHKADKFYLKRYLHINQSLSGNFCSLCLYLLSLIYRCILNDPFVVILLLVV